jgi:Tat protein secretion system quality control protein TatD with DNase activity
MTMRNAGDDFLKIIKENREEFDDAVVYIQKGNVKEIMALIELDMYIAINMCTLNDSKGREAVKKIPLNRLIV